MSSGRLSVDTATMVTPVAPRASSSGSSRWQGEHQLAQKFTTMTCSPTTTSPSVSLGSALGALSGRWVCSTGFRYHPWYRGAVPSTLDAELARIRLQSDPGNQGQLALVARGSYEQDDWAGALSHYTALIDAEPDNAAWLHGQARSQKRLGFHRGEISTWIRVLELAPDDVHAMGNRAVAHARLGDYEAADYWLVRMRGADSDDPYLYVFEAMVSAIEGDDDTALVLLEQTIASRHELPDGLQVELRRDLALDPALGSLRGDDRLQRMLSRQYGADRPRRLR